MIWVSRAWFFMILLTYISTCVHSSSVIVSCQNFPLLISLLCLSHKNYLNTLNSYVKHISTSWRKINIFLFLKLIYLNLNKLFLHLYLINKQQSETCNSAEKSLLSQMNIGTYFPILYFTVGKLVILAHCRVNC